MAPDGGASLAMRLGFWALTGTAAKYVPTSMAPDGGASLAMRLGMAGTWTEVMEVLAQDDRFREEYWGRQPLLAHVPAAAGCFSVDDVRSAVAEGEVLAGQNAFLVKNPDTFETAPGLPRGKLFTSELLEEGLLNGTLVMNDASASYSQIFDVVRASVRALKVPTNVNTYITHRSLERSTPLHTDRQDVLVLQCEGRKHWHIYPPVIELPAEHQELGKSGHIVDVRTLGAQLLSETLVPGHILYVPRGFVHATSKPPPLGAEADGGDASAFSTSLTVGLQTESMGFTFDKLLLCGLFLHGEGPTIDELRSLNSHHVFLRRPLPLPGSVLDPGSHPDPLEAAADEILAAWPAMFTRTAAPPPRGRLLRAAEILAKGHQDALREYEERMFDPEVPRKLRQEVWKRRYEALFYRMMGQCGFLTRCFTKKFWLPRHTTHQTCWGTAR